MARWGNRNCGFQKGHKINQGRKVNEETRNKKSITNKLRGIKPPSTLGLKHSIESIEKRCGKNHYNWKGDNVGYFGLHEWVKKTMGQPKNCEHCPKTDLKGMKIHWANISGKYRRDVNDWVRLCVKCHWDFDRESRMRAFAKV